MPKITGIILALLCITDLHAQFIVRQYGVDEGLPQTQVSSITEDAVGNLWLTTLGGGVTRFDGNTFNTYTTNEGLLHDFTTDVIVRDGKAYIGSQKGVSVYDGISFRDYPIDQTGITSKLFFSGDTLLMLKPDFTVVAVQPSIARKKQPWNILAVVTTHPYYALLLVETNGEEKLVIFGPDGFRVLNVSGKFNKLFASWSSKDKTFISTDKGIFTIGEDITLYQQTSLRVLAIDSVTGRYIARQGRAIVAFTPDDNKVITLIPEVDMRTNFMDSQGHFWIGANNGLFEIYPAPFQRIPQGSEGTGDPGDVALSIARMDNKFYVGTLNKTLKVYNNDVLESELSVPNHLHTIQPHSNGLWLGTTSLGWISPGKPIEWVIPKMGGVVLGIDFDKNGNGLIATDEGMHSFDGKSAVKLDTTSVKFAWCVKYDQQKDVFYIGTQHGLYTFKDNTFKLLLSNELTISSIDLLDDGSVLIGTFGNGVAIMRTDNVTWINRNKGLPSNTVYFATSFKGNIWVGTEKGISQVNPTDHVIYNYNSREGLNYAEANLNAYVKADDQLWVGLVGGLFHLNYSIEPSSKPLHVERVEISSSDSLKRNIDVIDGQPVSLELDPNENYIAFYLNKVDRLLSPHYRFRYFLDGYDEIWSDMGSARVAVFNKLPPGKYTLKVVATDPSGTRTYDNIKVELIIHPKFYQTVFFRVAAVLGIVALIVLIVFGYNRYKMTQEARLIQIRENEKSLLRKEISRDFHDELGNQAARLISYLGLLRINKGIDSKIYDSLNAYAQGILNGTKDFVWALDPVNDNLSNIMVHLKDFGERLFNEKNMVFRFQGNLEERVSLPMGYGRQINLIFKEAMTNAYKHSMAGEVAFSVKTTRDEIIISLHDFGVGVPAQAVVASERGLSNMQLRAKRLGGNLSISKAGEGGTLVAFRMSRPGT